MRIIFTIPVILLMLITACQQPAKQKTSDLDKLASEVRKKSPGVNAGADNFSIIAAEGWTKKDTSFSGLKCQFIRSPFENKDDRFQENLNVMTELCGEMDLETYYKAMRTNLETLYGFFERKVSEKTINGMEFKNLRYAHTYGGIPLDVDLYVTVKDGIAYLITCSSYQDEMSRWQATFESMVKTFTIN